MTLLLCKACIASEAGARWENWGISGDFLKYVYSIPLNAYDLSINVFQPECVEHDTNPFQLLRSISFLPINRVGGHEYLERLRLVFCMNFLK